MIDTELVAQFVRDAFPVAVIEEVTLGVAEPINVAEVIALCEETPFPDAEFFEVAQPDPLCVLVFDCDGSFVLDACEFVPDVVTVTLLVPVAATPLTVEVEEMVAPTAPACAPAETEGDILVDKVGEVDDVIEAD